MNPADVLEAAAEVIERDGWCRGRLFEVDGRVCLVGAIKRAAGMPMHEPFTHDTGKWTAAYDAIDAVSKHLDGEDVVVFNDGPLTKAADVIDVLKHAAKDLRNGETV